MFSLKSIVFIDAAVEDYSLLLAGLAPGIQAHIIQADTDGIVEITRVLRSHPNLDTVHIVAHGSPGSLSLGHTALSLDTLEQYSEALKVWSAQSILLYGCRVAAGDAGAEFVEKLHGLTGGAIAASTAVIGAAEQGPNWTLDYHHGHPQQSVLAFSQPVLASYPNRLPDNIAPIAPDDPDSETFDLVELSFFEMIRGATTGAANTGTVVTRIEDGLLTTEAQDNTVVFYRGRVKNDKTPNDPSDDIVDVRVTVVSRERDTGTAKFKLSGDDALFNFSASAQSGLSKTKLKFEFFETNTLIPYPLSISLAIEDLDNTAPESPALSGKVSTSRDAVSTYGLNAPTRLVVAETARNIEFTSTDKRGNSFNEAVDASEFALQLNYKKKTSFEIELTAEFRNSGFFFDTDRDFNFKNLITLGGDRATTAENQVLTAPAAGVLTNDFDPDGDNLVVTEVRSALGSTAVGTIGQAHTIDSGAIVTLNADGSYIYDPNGKFDDLETGESAKDSFVYTVSDGRGGSDQATVNITINGISNSPPSIDLNGSANGVDFAAETKGVAVNVADVAGANAVDLDGEQIISLSIAASNILDGANESLTLAGVTFFLDNDSSKTAGAFSLVQSGNGQSITVTKTDASPFRQTEIDTLIRGIEYRNGAAEPSLGDRSFRFTVNDGINASAPAASIVTILGSLNDDTNSTSEGVAVTTNVQANDDLKGNVTIPMGQTLNGTATVLTDNESIIFTPSPFFSGEETIVYDVNGETATLTVQVSPVAEMPTATAGNVTDGVENQAIALNLSGAALQDTDGSETLRYEISGVPTGGSFRDANGNPVGAAPATAGGAWRFTLAELSGLQFVPPADEFYEDTPLSLTLTGISTDTATIGGGPVADTQSASQTFSVTVREDSDGDGIPNLEEPPEVDLNGLGDGLGGADSAGVNFQTNFLAEGAAVAIADTDATATDPSGDDIETLTIALVGLADGAAEILVVGTTAIALNTNSSQTLSVSGIESTLAVTVSDNGATVQIAKSSGGDLTQAEADALVRSLQYQNTAQRPDLGDRSFTLIANDGSQNSAPATSTLRLSAELKDDNAPPTAENVSQLIDVLSNDQLSGPIDSIATDPSNGTATIENGQIRYIPAPGFSGTDTLVYEVDGQTATVSITVNPVAEAPENAAGDVSGMEGEAIALNLTPNPLSDTDGSETLTYSLTGMPSSGEIPGGGSFSFINASGNPVGTQLPDGSWSFLPSELVGLQIQPPPGYAGELSLSLVGTSTDSGNGQTVTDRSAPANFTVSFLSNGGDDVVPDDRPPEPPQPINPPAQTPRVAGNDELTGTEGSDVLNGLSDQDSLDGGGGNDVVNGGSERDRVLGGDGDDLLSGGTGDDEIFAGNGDDIASGGSGNDRVLGEAGNDLLSGGSGDDQLMGGGGGDILLGGRDNDLLYGEADSDNLQGGRGDDLLVGGDGADMLSGGQGSDTFKYDAVSEFGDRILDFEILFDRIDLSSLYGGNGSFGSTVQATQQGRNTLITAQVNGGLQTVATLLNVNAFALGDRHFLL